MKIEALKEALDSGMNVSLQKCYLPVLGETCTFKALTVAQLKTLAKTLVSSEDKPFDIYESLCAMIKSLCCENIDMAKLSEFDRMKIMFELLSANDMISDFNIKCKECGEQNSLAIDSVEIINKLNKYEYKEISFDNELDDRLTCEISIPTVRKMYSFYYMVQNEQLKDEDLLKCFINNIKISFSNKDVEDIELSHGEDEESLKEFIDNFEILPAILLKNKKTQKSVDDFVADFVSDMYDAQEVSGVCKKCGAKIGGGASASNFI